MWSHTFLLMQRLRPTRLSVTKPYLPLFWLRLLFQQAAQRCEHLHKGQVWSLRGALLVSSPVRRSNEPSNHCYLFMSVTHRVIQASWGTLRCATSIFKSNIPQMWMAAILEEIILLVSCSVLFDELIINRGDTCAAAVIKFYCSISVFIAPPGWGFHDAVIFFSFFFQMLINLPKTATQAAGGEQREGESKRWSGFFKPQGSFEEKLVKLH